MNIFITLLLPILLINLFVNLGTWFFNSNRGIDKGIVFIILTATQLVLYIIVNNVFNYGITWLFLFYISVISAISNYLHYCIDNKLTDLSLSYGNSFLMSFIVSTSFILLSFYFLIL